MNKEKKFSSAWFDHVVAFTEDYHCDYGGGFIIDDFLDRVERFREVVSDIFEETLDEVLGRDFAAWNEEDLKKALSVWKGFKFGPFWDTLCDVLCDAGASSWAWEIFDELEELIDRITDEIWRVD